MTNKVFQRFNERDIKLLYLVSQIRYERFVKDFSNVLYDREVEFSG